jgi:uncharacterized membrane protein YdjX (TVP38/TMEM64 family)
MISERTQAVVRIALLAAIIVAALAGAWRIGLLDDPARAKATLQNARQLRNHATWFMLVFAITAAIGVPPFVLTLAGGAVYGTKFGIIYSWIGAFLGALGGYALARGMGGDSIRQLLGRRSAKLDRILDRATTMSLFRLRVNPIVPFNVMNFACGMTKVALRDYAVATAFGIIPATFVYAYFADSLIGGATGAKERARLHIAIASLVIILLSFGPSTWRRLFDRDRDRDAPAPE